MSSRQFIAGGVTACVVWSVAGSAAAIPGTSPGVTSRVTVSSTGRQGNGPSERCALSADGRFVVFDSKASNLVPGDTNNADDVFVRDRLAGVTRRVSVGATGQGNDASYYSAISADGRFVAFESYASNLVPRDTNGTVDVFVRDLLTGVTRRVSVGAAGQANAGSYGTNAMSANGRYVAFISAASDLVPGDTNRADDVFIGDRLAGVTRRVSVGADGQGNSSSYSAAMSADGRFVAFTSAASNLVPRDTNGMMDVFVRDRVAGVTRRVSVTTDGRQGNGDSSGFGWPTALSADGRLVAFGSDASNLVPGDTNGMMDVFVRDWVAGVTRRVSVGAAGQANSYGYGPSITADGRSVAFVSNASNLVSGDTNGGVDAFVRDPLLGAEGVGAHLLGPGRQDRFR